MRSLLLVDLAGKVGPLSMLPFAVDEAEEALRPLAERYGEGFLALVLLLLYQDLVEREIRDPELRRGIYEDTRFVLEELDTTRSGGRVELAEEMGN